MLSSQSVAALTASLCDESILSGLTWGLVKGETPFGLCRSWDDMNLDGSDLIDEEVLFQWLDGLRTKGLLQSYEKVTD